MIMETVGQSPKSREEQARRPTDSPWATLAKSLVPQGTAESTPAPSPHPRRATEGSSINSSTDQSKRRETKVRVRCNTPPAVR